MFNSLCYYLNFINPNWVAALRRLLFETFKEQAFYVAYQSPNSVGYQGSWELPYLGTVAFLPLEDDDLVYRW